jgi:hypothetical protein
MIDEMTKEIKENAMDDVKISQRILKILEEARHEIVFGKGFQDLDASFYDVDIDLKVTVDTRTVRIKDKWSRVEA